MAWGENQPPLQGGISCEKVKILFLIFLCTSKVEFTHQNLLSQKDGITVSLFLFNAGFQYCFLVMFHEFIGSAQKRFNKVVNC